MPNTYLLHQFLECAAQRSPDHPFLIHDGAATAYGEVEAGANRAARVLVDQGISRGDRIGLLALNSRFYVEMYYGILKAGGIAVPLNTAADDATLAKFVRSCGARMLIAGRRFEKVSKAAIESGTPLEILGLETKPRLPEPAGVRVGGPPAAASPARVQRV